MLIYEIKNAGSKNHKGTGREKISYGDIYTFYLGCIVGNYAINAADTSFKKKVRGVRKHLKEMYFE